jgi:hypothetical protein
MVRGGWAWLSACARRAISFGLRVVFGLVDALEQLLFYRTESGRAPSDLHPLDLVTSRALSPLKHHSNFIVALLRTSSR